MRGKLQILESDIDPELNPDAKYFIEAQYVSEDDAEWGNQDNAGCLSRLQRLHLGLAQHK